MQGFLDYPVLGIVPDIEVCHLLDPLIFHFRVQKCVDLNHMSTKNLALLFAPSLFQTDGKGEHEVKVMEDLIDNYVHIFNVSGFLACSPSGPCLLALYKLCFAYVLSCISFVAPQIDENQVSQMDLENSLITTWRDVQVPQLLLPNLSACSPALVTETVGDPLDELESLRAHEAS